MSSSELPSPWRGTAIWLALLAFFWAGLLVNARLDEDLAEGGSELVKLEGEVTKSELRTISHGGGPRYELDLVASYEVDGRKYKVAPDLFGIEGDDELSEEELSRRYPLHGSIDVWVTAGDPSVAYLKPPEGGYGRRFRVNLVLLTIGTFVVLGFRVRAHQLVRDDPALTGR